MAFGPKHHLHLIDGSAFIFRAYHALPPLVRKSDNLPTGAVSGFCNMLYRYIENNNGNDAPTHIAVIFDKGSYTFRNDIYPAYKANRTDMPVDLRPQIPLTRSAVDAFNIACKEIDGFEADDIIATLAYQAHKQGGRVTIVSSDKDMMQLVNKNIKMFDAMKNKMIDTNTVIEKFGVPPERVVDVQALAGDSIDNIPGAPGIGIKTASQLINDYGDLDTLLRRVDTIKQNKRKQILIENSDQIQLSRQLVLLRNDVPLGFGLDDLVQKPIDPYQLLEFLTKMEFRTLTNRIIKAFDLTPPTSTKTVLPKSSSETPARDWLVDFSHQQYLCVTTLDALEKWIDDIYQNGFCAIDTETTGLDTMRAELVGISLATRPGYACYIPLAHKQFAAVSGQQELFLSDSDKPVQPALVSGQIPMDIALNTLKPILTDKSILKIGHNIKYDNKILTRYGIDLDPLEDTMLMSYALYSGLHMHALDVLSERYLRYTPMPIKNLIGRGQSAITFDYVPIKDATHYAAEDTDMTIRLWHLFKSRLSKNKVSKVYHTLERPLIQVLTRMEQNGILVDCALLAKISAEFTESMRALEQEIYEHIGENINLASPAQIGHVLFDKLSLPGGKKAKSGTYITSADVLGDLAHAGHTIAAKILDWRQLAKLKATYTDALPEHINAKTKRIHTSYSLTGASTGRLSSSTPNLQNIPIRTHEGRQIRHAFIAKPEHVLLSLDYSQIELRLLAHIAKIDALKEAFYKGQDIHSMTASELFNIPLTSVDSMQRRQAKAINFGIIYGISSFGLARNLQISRQEAHNFIDSYFARFPGIRQYMDATISFAQKHHFVQTLFGRRIHTPFIHTKGAQAGFAKRAAINAPIQGSAADIIKRAMIQISPVIVDLPVKMLLQVHDELIFEVKASAIHETIDQLKPIMENAAFPVVHMDIPLVIDAGYAGNWDEAH